MAEKPGSGSGRMKHGGTRATPPIVSRRDFGKLLGIAGLAITAAVVEPKVVKYIDNLASENKLDGLRKSFPTLDGSNVYILSPDQEQIFLHESWSEKFQIGGLPQNPNLDTIATASEEAAKSALAELERRMGGSIFKPFPDTIFYLGRFFNKDVPGKIDLGLDFFPSDKTGGDTVFRSLLAVSPSGEFQVKIAANADLFSPDRQSEVKNILTKLTWSLSLFHEKSHHVLGLKVFDFWTHAGLKPEDALTKTGLDVYQEPYAYWNQGVATYPLLKFGFSQVLPFSFGAVAEKWKELSQLGMHWYDSAWVDFINKEITTKPVTNSPFNQAGVEHSLIPSSKEWGWFKA